MPQPLGMALNSQAKVPELLVTTKCAENKARVELKIARPSENLHISGAQFIALLAAFAIAAPRRLSVSDSNSTNSRLVQSTEV